MKIEEAKEFIKFLSEYIEEIEGTHHKLDKEIRFFLGEDELELNIPEGKNSSYACDVQTTMGCGCWLGVDISLRKKNDQ